MSTSKSFCQYLPDSKKKLRRKKRIKDKINRPERQVKSFVQTVNPNHKNGTQRTYDQGLHTIEKLKIDLEEINIFHIDSQIKENIKAKMSTLDELRVDLRKILLLMNNSCDPISRVMAVNEVSNLRQRIKDLESASVLSLYMFRTCDLLDEFRNLQTKSISTFTAKNKDITIENRKKEIIMRYLCIAQEYIDIINFQQKASKMMCSCGSTDFVLDNDDSKYICQKCFVSIDRLDDSPSYKDTDRVNMSSRYTYTKKGHFLDTIKRFQGIQNTDPKRIEKVVEDIRNEMRLHNLTEKTITKDQIYMFLSENELRKHYEDLNLIHHIITGIPCPNISEYENILLELFDKQEEAYSKVERSGRINSLNVNYKLYKLLQRVGYPCRKDDFYILKTKNKEDEHDETMKEAWKLLGWDWIETY